MEFRKKLLGLRLGGLAEAGPGVSIPPCAGACKRQLGCQSSTTTEQVVCRRKAKANAISYPIGLEQLPCLYDTRRGFGVRASSKSVLRNDRAKGRAPAGKRIRKEAQGGSLPTGFELHNDRGPASGRLFFPELGLKPASQRLTRGPLQRANPFFQTVRAGSLEAQ